MTQADALLEGLERDGIVVLPGFVSGPALAGMQMAFSVALERMNVNGVCGYEKGELLRDTIAHPLLLDPGYVDLGVHPTVIEVVRRYVGEQFQLVECKGWRSRTTVKDWHGWHGDSWYDQDVIHDHIPRELKLGLYLTDVASGGLAYVRGSHRATAPQLYPRKRARPEWYDSALPVNGPAGTIVLFDTSGVHRQSCPILTPRNAVFYCYHDPAVPLQADDVDYNRYAPLHLNAAFIGGLSAEEQRILGFGDRSHFVPAHRRRDPPHGWVNRLIATLIDTTLWVDLHAEPLRRRLAALLSR